MEITPSKNEKEKLRKKLQRKKKMARAKQQKQQQAAAAAAAAQRKQHTREGRRNPIATDSYSTDTCKVILTTKNKFPPNYTQYKDDAEACGAAVDSNNRGSKKNKKNRRREKIKRQAAKARKEEAEAKEQEARRAPRILLTYKTLSGLMSESQAHFVVQSTLELVCEEVPCPHSVEQQSKLLPVRKALEKYLSDDQIDKYLVPELWSPRYMAIAVARQLLPIPYSCDQDKAVVAIIDELWQRWAGFIRDDSEEEVEETDEEAWARELWHQNMIELGDECFVGFMDDSYESGWDREYG
jgi:hypothetical protein